MKEAAEIESALLRAAQARAQGLMAITTNLVVTSRQRIAELALAHRLPAISEFSLMTQAGLSMRDRKSVV